MRGIRGNVHAHENGSLISMPMSNLAHALLIFGLTFVLEDIAVLGAALLVVNRMVGFPWAAGAAFAGIWLGDIGLYVLAYRLGRPVLNNRWFQKFMGKVDLHKSEAWFQSHGTLAIVISRAIPGTRLPTYLAAGFLKVPAWRFVTVTAAACAVWVTALFFLSYHVGMMVISVFSMFRSELTKALACVVLAAILGWILRKALQRISRNWVAKSKKIWRWEFWPPYIFYAPVAVKYLTLAVRYRSLSLPTISNPGMHLGGLIGESKYETLADLASAHPGFVAQTLLAPYESVVQQQDSVRAIFAEGRMNFPCVFKPDVGQRGDGFKVIRSAEDAKSYVSRFRRTLLVQEYVPGPAEAGIFYYRLPGGSRGRIFSITRKIFPVVTGDGTQTLEQLIRGDARASIIANVYLRRFKERTEYVPKGGESVRLVEAGNHCQGAIFLEGADLATAKLEDRIEDISSSAKGFFAGRYDVRYESDDALRKGLGFTIIELNGASSEATNVYDPQNSLCSAYRTLFRQWEIVFEIGDRNRKGGLKPAPWKEVWMDWTNYRHGAAGIPVSD